jgi:hypothetical protein
VTGFLSLEELENAREKLRGVGKFIAFDKKTRSPVRGKLPEQQFCGKRFVGIFSSYESKGLIQSGFSQSVGVHFCLVFFLFPIQKGLLMTVVLFLF